MRCVTWCAVARDSLSVGPTGMVPPNTNSSAQQEELGAVRVVCSSETKTATARGLLRLEAEQAWVRLAQQLQLPLTILRLGGEPAWLNRRLHDALLLRFAGWAHTFTGCLVAFVSFSEQHVCASQGACGAGFFLLHHACLLAGIYGPRRGVLTNLQSQVLSSLLLCCVFVCKRAGCGRPQVIPAAFASTHRQFCVHSKDRHAHRPTPSPAMCCVCAAAAAFVVVAAPGSRQRQCRPPRPATLHVTLPRR